MTEELIWLGEVQGGRAGHCRMLSRISKPLRPPQVPGLAGSEESCLLAAWNSGGSASGSGAVLFTQGERPALPCSSVWLKRLLECAVHSVGKLPVVTDSLPSE